LLPALLLTLGACASDAPTAAAPHAFAHGIDAGAARLARWERTPGAPGAAGFAVTAKGDLLAVNDAAGLFRAQHDGHLWTAVGGIGAEAGPRSIAVAPSGTIYVGTMDGVRRSDDGGTTWVAAGMTGMLVTQLAVDPRGSVFAASP